ncbi:VOC family protein [Angustibacter luteus]|uniref:VOC family protein n=1 Tax=Angustibacter luteus TaxID=658456 RepID=A0ABW1JCH2_9ACTN
MSRTVQIVFDAAEPAKVGDFWASALGYVRESPPEGFDTWPQALEAFGVPEALWDSADAVVDPDGSGPRLFIQKVPEGKTVKNRVHLDIRVSARGDDREVADAAVLAEAERLESIGASRVEWREGMGSRWLVMQDVEGNEFCVT